MKHDAMYVVSDIPENVNINYDLLEFESGVNEIATALGFSENDVNLEVDNNGMGDTKWILLCHKLRHESKEPIYLLFSEYEGQHGYCEIKTNLAGMKRYQKYGLSKFVQKYLIKQKVAWNLEVSKGENRSIVNANANAKIKKQSEPDCESNLSLESI